MLWGDGMAVTRAVTMVGVSAAWRGGRWGDKRERRGEERVRVREMRRDEEGRIDREGVCVCRAVPAWWVAETARWMAERWVVSLVVWRVVG